VADQWAGPCGAGTCAAGALWDGERLVEWGTCGAEARLGWGPVRLRPGWAGDL